MHLIAYEGGKNKGTFCHGLVLYQIIAGTKKPATMSGLLRDYGASLFAAHNFSEDKCQDTTPDTAGNDAAQN